MDIDGVISASCIPDIPSTNVVIVIGHHRNTALIFIQYISMHAILAPLFAIISNTPGDNSKDKLRPSPEFTKHLLRKLNGIYS